MTDEIIYNGSFLQFRKRGKWEFVSRNNATAVVAIAALTGQREVVLIEQRRAVLGKAGERVLEVPAGLVGDDQEDDSLEEAVRRELIEECGFDASHIHIQSHGPSSAGLCDEIITLVKATGLTRVGPGGGVGGEDITTHLVPIDEVHAWLDRRIATGMYIEPKVYAALYLLTSPCTP